MLEKGELLASSSIKGQKCFNYKKISEKVVNGAIKISTDLESSKKTLCPFI